MSDVNAIINIDINSSSALVNLKRLESQIDQFNRSVVSSNATAAAAQQSLNKALLDGINNTGLFTSKITPVESSMMRFSRSVDEGRLSLNEYARSAGSQLPGLSRVFRKEFDNIEQVATSRVKSMQTQYLALGKTVDGVTKAIASTPTGLAKGMATDLAMTQQRQQIFNKLLDDGSTKLLNWGKNTQWAGRQLMVGFSLPLAAFGAAAAKTFMEIDKATISLKRVYGDLSTTKAELDSNVESVKNLGKEYTKYGITLSDTISLSARAAATGATNEGLMAATEQTLRFATLGQMDYNQALDTTISLQTAFAISNEDLGKTVDYLNAVENQTILTMEDMSLAIPRVATVVKGLGGSVEDLAIMMTAMREGGVSAENAANGLKSGLASLINPTNRASESLNKMGVNLNSIITQNKGDLMGIITEFGTAINKLDEFSRQQVLEQVFGKYQYARMSALFTNITKDAGQAARAMDIAGMSATDLAKISEKELGQISESTSVKFQAAMEQLKISIAPIGEAFLKGITPVVNMVSKIAEAFNNLPDGVKNSIAVITAVVAGLGPVFLMTVGLLGNGIANLIKGFQFVRKMLAGIKGDASAFTWLAQGELEATTASKALEGSTTILTDKLLLQRGAVAGLTAEYERFARAAGIARAEMGTMGGASMPRGGGRPPMPTPRIRKNAGGTIPGVGSTDTVPAMLTPGEFVINKKSTAQNLPLLHAINNGQAMGAFNKGGQIPGMQYFAANMPGRIVKPRKNINSTYMQAGRGAPQTMRSNANIISGGGYSDELFLDIYALGLGKTRETLSTKERTSLLRRLSYETSSGLKVKSGYGGATTVAHIDTAERTASGLKKWKYDQTRITSGLENSALQNVFRSKKSKNFFSSLTDDLGLNLTDSEILKSIVNGRHPNSIHEYELLEKLFTSAKLDPSRLPFKSQSSNNMNMDFLIGVARGRKNPETLASHGPDPYNLFTGEPITFKETIKRAKGSLGPFSFSKGGQIPGGKVTQNRSFYGIVTPKSNKLFEALTTWQTSSRAVRENPEMLGTLMNAMSPLKSRRTLTRGTTIGLNRGSEFSQADELAIMDALQSGNIDSLIGREFDMKGPISYTAGKTESAVNAMNQNADVNRIKFLKTQQSEAQKRQESNLNRVKTLKEKIAKGTGPVDLYKAQLKELEGFISMFPAGQASMQAEIKGLASRGYQNLLIEQDFIPGSPVINVDRANPNGTFMGKKLEESEFLSGGSRVRIKSVGLDEKTGVRKLQLETIPSNVVKEASVNARKGNYPGTVGKSGQEIRADIEQRKALISIMDPQRLLAEALKPEVGGYELSRIVQSVIEKATDPKEKRAILKAIANNRGQEIGTSAWGGYNQELGYATRGAADSSTWRQVWNTLKNEGTYIPWKKITGPQAQSRNLGGPIFESQSKIVPGVGNTDTVPAMLTPGEFVINKKATQQNLGLLHAINNGQSVKKNKGGIIDGIQYFAKGGAAQSDRGSASGSGAYKKETQRIMDVGWDSLQTEKLILETMRDNNEITQSQYDAFKQGETSHITPEVGPNGGKMWRPSNMMADLGLINNYIEAQKGTSKKALGNAKLFDEIQSKTSLSAERLRAELDLLSRGFHATTKESAIALKALSQVGDQTAQKIAVSRVLEARLQGTFYDTLDAPERQYRSDLPIEEKFGKRGKRDRRIPKPETRDQRRPPKVSPQEADRIRRQARTEAERSLIAERGVPMTPNSDYEKEIEKRAKEIRTREYERRNKEHGREQARLIAISRQSKIQQPTLETDMNVPNPEEERNLRKQSRRQKIGKGLKGAGGAIGMLSMLPFMMQNQEGKFMGMDANMLGTGMMVGGMAMPAVGSAIAGAGGIGAAAAAAAPIAAFLLPLAAGAIALKIYTDKVNDAARASADMGANLGVTANSLNKIGGLLGTSTPAQRRQQTSLNLSNKELSQSFGEFGSILQSEGGQGFIQELKNATSTERAKKFTDYLRAGVASGMLSSDQARKFADVMGVAVGDSLMSTLAKKGLLGIDGSGAKSYLELSRQRKEALPRADVDALKTAISKALNVKDVTVSSFTPTAGGKGGSGGGGIQQQITNLKKTIDPLLASSAVGSSIQIIQDYSNTVQLAREDLDAGKITQKEYNLIVKESIENQKTYTKTISDAISYSADQGSTLLATEKQLESLGMTAEEIGKFAETVGGVGKEDIGRYYAEAAAAAVQGMLPSDIQTITDYALGEGKGGTAARTLTSQEYAGQGYALSALAMNVEQGGILGLDKKQAQQAVDIAFKFTEQGGSVAEYQQFLMTLPENKVVTIQTKLEGLSETDLYKFTKGFNDIAAKGGIDLAVNVMFDENGKPITGKELSETVKKTDAALNKMSSSKKKVKKEGSIELLTQIRGADGEQLSRQQAEGQWDSLVKQFGEQKILNLPTDILTKVLDLNVEISEDTLELIDLDNQLKTATGEQAMLILKRMAEIKSNKTRLEGEQAGLVSLNQPPIIPEDGDKKTGGAGEKANPLLDLKKSILEQIKMYVDINATMKKLNDQKYKFADIIMGGQGVFDKLKSIKGIAGGFGASGLGSAAREAIMGMGPDAAKKWIEKNTTKNKKGQTVLTKKGQEEANRLQAVSIKGTMVENVNAFESIRAQGRAAVNLRRKGVGDSVVQSIAGDPEKAKQLDFLQQQINNKIKGSKKLYWEFVNGEKAAIEQAELLARAQDPIQTQIDDMTLAHRQITSEIDKQITKYQDQVDLINKEIEAIQELNDDDQNRIRNLDRQKEIINRQIETLNRANELDQRRADSLKREDEIRNRTADAISHDLDVMSKKESEIQDAYDKRIKALDEVAKINDYIISQQRSQLGLAQALSQGDVYAAAAAQQEMQAGSAQFAQAQMRTGLQTGMENQIAGLTTAGGLTRDQAEAQIAAIKEQSYQISLQIRDIEDAIYNRNLEMIPLKDSQLLLDDQIRVIQDLIYERESQIIIIQDGKLAAAQSFLDKQVEIKTQLDKNFEQSVSDLELQNDLRKMSDAQANSVNALAMEYGQVADQLMRINKIANEKLIALGGQPEKRITETGADFEKRLKSWRDSIAAIEAERKASSTTAVSSTPISNAASSVPVAGSSGRGMLMATGGIVGQGGRDSIPAMLTPGEFVMRKASVQKYGMPMLSSMNMGAFDMPRYNMQDNPTNTPTVVTSNNTTVSAPVYNSYSVNVNSTTNASADEIANTVMTKIKRVDSMAVRNFRGY